MKTALGFLSGNSADYGRRLSRLRWRRALPQAQAVALSADEPAAAALRAADAWFLVFDETAVPLWHSHVPRPEPGRLLFAAAPPEGACAVHTLRELEGAAWRFTGGRRQDPEIAPALAFRTADYPALQGETLNAFAGRLAGERALVHFDPGFAAVRFEDPSERERPELESQIPAKARRLLDVGCGSGGTSAAAKSRRPCLVAVGIEKDPEAAHRARTRLDRVLEEDAIAALARLASERECFDVFLFADVLEHLEDPFAALGMAHDIALPGATLVSSVPNAGHLSLVRDLLLGRFDPVPAGLEDAGHLRWFTRGSLTRMLGDTGWNVSLIESLPGAAAPEQESFLSWACLKPAVERETLRTYQWIAVATAGG